MLNNYDILYGTNGVIVSSKSVLESTKNREKMVQNRHCHLLRMHVQGKLGVIRKNSPTFSIDIRSKFVIIFHCLPRKILKRAKNRDFRLMGQLGVNFSGPNHEVQNNFCTAWLRILQIVNV